MYYLLFKSLHLIAMVAWFAGLFYLVRIFVYHTEAFDKSEQERDVLTAQYAVMASRLYRIICNPAMVLTWIFGLSMLYMNGLTWFKENPWMHVKLLMLLLLTAYHHMSPGIMRKLKQGNAPMSAFRFRLFNEVPTIFLVSIVVLAVFKNLTNFGLTFASIAAFGILLFLFARLYKKQRAKNQQNVSNE